METATEVLNKKVGNGVLRRYCWTASTVLAGQVSDEIKLIVPVFGTLIGFGVVAPTSVDFDFSVRQKSGITTPDKDEILKVVDETTGSYKEFNLRIPYLNNDVTETAALYLVFTNTDIAHASGILQIEALIAT